MHIPALSDAARTARAARDGLVERWLTLSVGLIALVLAFAMGQVAATGNYILAGAGLGLLIVLCLMAVPAVSVWAIIVLPLGLSGLLALIGPIGSKFTWVVSILSVILLGPSLVAMAWRRRVPGYVWLALGFMVYAVLVSVVAGVDIKQLVAGFKRYFQGYGLLLALAALSFSATQVDRWRKAFGVIALAQFPMCLFQLLVLVRLRGGIAAGGEATDVVAGTFGGNLQGGSNGSDLALYQMMALSFMLAYASQGVYSLRQRMLTLLLVAAPLAMGETKVVVLMLPLCIFGVYAEKLIQHPGRLLGAIVGVGLASLGLAVVYAELFMGITLGDMVDNAIRYNFKDVGYGMLLLNRWTSITFWFDNHSIDNIPSWFFGHGLSASYSSMFRGESGHVAEHYLGFGIDLTTISATLWDLGFIGLMWLIAIPAVAIIKAHRLAQASADASVRAEAIGIRTTLLMSLLYLPYNNSLVNLITTEVIVAALLGYLAILLRHHEQAPALPDR